ncbi:MAG: twin-arginine translocation signal domain-containing protein, partial [Pirellula sp.]
MIGRRTFMAGCAATAACVSTGLSSKSLRSQEP